MLKRAYQVVCILAVSHLTALVGLLGLLAVSGRLTPAKVQAMASAWREEKIVERAAAEPQELTERPPASQTVGETAEQQLERLRGEQEVWRQYVARELREIDDRNRLAEMIRLDVVRRQEKLAKDHEGFLSEQRRIREQAQLSGFTKELESLSAANTKKRKAILMGKKDADALLLLMEMETRKVKQVIDACKTDTEIAWIGRLLQKMHTLDGEKAAELDNQLPAPAEQRGAAP